jgi:molybdopterin-guanine dinucleotide biosynthesis protein A
MNNILKDCSGVILAGGENRRMPILKAFIKIEGEKIIERNIKIMKQFFEEVFIITNEPEVYSYLDVPLLGDVYNVRGPMTGIFTSLLNSSNSWVFISACDMPYINHELIRFMSLKRDNYEAVVPEYNGNIEPLFSFYSRRLLLPMEEAIFKGKTGLQYFLKNKKVKYITTREIRDIDPQGKSFINLNTPQDLSRELNVNFKQ